MRFATSMRSEEKELEEADHGAEGLLRSITVAPHHFGRQTCCHTSNSPIIGRTGLDLVGSLH